MIYFGTLVWCCGSAGCAAHKQVVCCEEAGNRRIWRCLWSFTVLKTDITRRYFLSTRQSSLTKTNKQRVMMALDRQGTQQQRPESLTVAPSVLVLAVVSIVCRVPWFPSVCWFFTSAQDLILFQIIPVWQRFFFWSTNFVSPLWWIPHLRHCMTYHEHGCSSLDCSCLVQTRYARYTLVTYQSVRVPLLTTLLLSLMLLASWLIALEAVMVACRTKPKPHLLT